jgi:hypothetical protein
MSAFSKPGVFVYPDIVSRDFFPSLADEVADFAAYIALDYASLDSVIEPEIPQLLARLPLDVIDAGVVISIDASGISGTRIVMLETLARHLTKAQREAVSAYTLIFGFNRLQTLVGSALRPETQHTAQHLGKQSLKLAIDFLSQREGASGFFTPEVKAKLAEMRIRASRGQLTYMRGAK